MLRDEKKDYLHTMTLQDAGAGVYHTTDAVTLGDFEPAWLMYNGTKDNTPDLYPLVSFDGTTYTDLTNGKDGTWYIADADWAASTWISLPLDVFRGVYAIKFRMGASGSEADQGSAETFTLITQPLLADGADRVTG
jgi:hypothetical protein